jgi:hypothetical protein
MRHLFVKQEFSSMLSYKYIIKYSRALMIMGFMQRIYDIIKKFGN